MNTPLSADEQFHDIVGLSVEEAKALHPDYTFRVTHRDGFPLICTRDFRRDRVNVKVIDDKIDDIGGIG